MSYFPPFVNFNADSSCNSEGRENNIVWLYLNMLSPKLNFISSNFIPVFKSNLHIAGSSVLIFNSTGVNGFIKFVTTNPLFFSSFMFKSLGFIALITGLFVSLGVCATHFSSEVPSLINLHNFPKLLHLYSEHVFPFSLHFSQSDPPAGATHGLHVAVKISFLSSFPK